jgi:pimeloyl-ACP methyl ester carboxylesterase
MAKSAARPRYVGTGFGQVRVWRSGAGPLVVVLPGLIRAASVVAADLAQRAPGLAFAVIELPGVGGSAAVPCGTARQGTAAVAAAIAALGVEDAPVLALDLAGGLTAGLEAPAILVTGADDLPPLPDVSPRPDGTHLTALFAHLRNAHVLDRSQTRAAPAGERLPDAAELDATVAAAGERPAAFAALWAACLGATPSAAAERMPDIATALARLRDLALRPAADASPAVRDGGDIWCDDAATSRGRMHLRCAGRGGIPLIALASAPGSTAPLRPVISALAAERFVVAPDYLGNGGSDKPAEPVTIAVLAADILALADALDLARFDLFGTHTGALIALELAILAPSRVRRMVLEAPPLLSPELGADILAHYFPPLLPHPWGLHLQQAWNLRRDMFLFWPWYRAERAAARPLALPDADFLHDWTIGLLQSGATYDRSYRAAFEYDTRRRLPLLSHPALVCAGPSDMLADGLAAARALAPGHVTLAATPATAWYPHQPPAAVAATLAEYKRFLAA